MIMTILAQDAGHQTIASTRIAAASIKRQKQNFMKITSIQNIFLIKSKHNCLFKKYFD